MATTPFTPADGVKARWRWCYELVAEHDVDDEITLDEVMDLLDCDADTAWAAMREARDHLEADGRRSVDTVPGHGWRVASASVQLRMAGDRTKRARRQVKKAIRVINATPRDELTQFERQSADRQASMLTAMADLHKRRVKRSLGDMSRENGQGRAAS